MRQRYDERDTIFSRMFELEPGTARYREYYDAHPELEVRDQELRADTEPVFADRIWENALIDGGFSFLRELRSLSGAGEPFQETKQGTAPLSAEEITANLAETAVLYGASHSGACFTPLEFSYSVRGRGGHYGKKNNGLLPSAFVFAVPMKPEGVMAAPAVEETVEVVRAYTAAAAAGMVLRFTLLNLGYDAVCHMDGESQFVLPPLAERAGIGQIGWMGILLTRSHGPRVRLGAVSTNAPLIPSAPVAGSILSFCKTCGKCAEVCPSRAIAPITDQENSEKPSISHTACYRTWRELGTDCGACLAVCPLGKNVEDTGSEKPGPGDPEFLKSLLYGS